MRQAIQSENAPQPRGPYSPAMVAHGPTVYVSAQGPIDPGTNQVPPGGFAAEAEQVFRNVGALLEAAGTSWAHAVKVTVYLADFANFAVMNEAYQRHLQTPYPARTTVQSAIGQNSIVVDCVALLPQA